MGHQPRHEGEDAVHHVYARGNRRQEIFVDDQDRRTYLGMLGSVVRRCRWRCLAFCLMDNHVHLLIETPEANLGLGMQRLHAPYAQAFNRRHKSVGHLFQGRYGAERIHEEAQLIATLRYIALNPVEAGACDDARMWRWSSHAMMLNGMPPGWLDADRVAEYLAAWGSPPEARLVALA
jgi:REP element-mobilizing transposase RayT